jgi:hypothetical protein
MGYNAMIVPVLSIHEDLEAQVTGFVWDELVEDLLHAFPGGKV